MKRKAQPISDEIRRMTVPFELKAVTEGETSSDIAGEMSGYAAGIHNIDRVGDMILPGAFVEDLPRFLAEGAVCWQHDWADPIGKPTEAREDGHGLFTKCQIVNTARGKDAMILMRNKVVTKLSIGYRVQDYQWVDRAGLVAYLAGCGLPDGKCQSILRQYDEEEWDELFLIKKLKLYEYSPVTIPANPNASITAAKGLPFAEHSQAVLTGAREISERVKSIHTLRRAQDKKANQQHLELCHDLAGQFESIAEELRAQAAEMSADKSDAQTLYNRFLSIEARDLHRAWEFPL